MAADGAADPARRPGLRASALPALAALLLAACSSAPASPASSPSAPAKASLKIAVGGEGRFDLLPVALAGQLGYFRAAGIEVEVDDLKTGPDAQAALSGGAVDAVAELYTSALRGQATGHPAPMIAVLDAAPGLALLVNSKHADATAIKDLATLNIGVDALGSASDDLVRYLFQSAGLDPASARIVPAGAGDAAVSAFRNDTLQALVAAEPLASRLEQAGEAKPLYDLRTAAGARAVLGGSMPGAGICVSAGFVRQYPRTAEALARAMVEALRYLQSHTGAEIAAHVPARLFYPDGNRSRLERVVEARRSMFSPDGRMPADGPATALRVLRAADPTTDWSRVDLARTYDNSFVTRVR